MNLMTLWKLLKNLLQKLLQLLEDSVQDKNIQINLFEAATDGGLFTTGSMFQVALRNGPLDPQENREACAMWLDKWMKNRGIWHWRLSRQRNIGWHFLAFIFHLKFGRTLQTTQGRNVDYAVFLPKIDGWVSSSVDIPWFHPQRAELMDFYVDKFDAMTDCWGVITPLDLRHHQDDFFLAHIEYNCWPPDKHRATFQALEHEIERRFPSVRRYVNVPIQMETKADDEMMVRRYFPNLAELQGLKAKFDPQNTFSPYQGILPKDDAPCTADMEPISTPGVEPSCAVQANE